VKFAKSISIIIFVVLLDLSLGAFSATAASPWTSVTSKNFTIAGDAAEPQLKAVAIRLEQFRDALTQLLPEIRFDAGVRTNVIVFKDQATYRPFKPRRPDGTPDDPIKGYFLGSDDVNYVTLAIDGGDDPYRTIKHEYIHFVLKSNIGMGIPHWINEGLAEYFETLQIDSTGHITMGAVPGDHLRLLKQNPLIPIKTLVSIDSTTLHGHGDDPRSLFYAESWAIVHYLVQRQGLERVVAMASKTDPIEILLGTDIDAFEQSFRSYISQPSLPITDVAATHSISGQLDVTSAPISEAQANAYLGDLLYHHDRLDEAEPLLRRAIAIDPNSSLGHMSLGLLLIHKKDFGKARKHLEIAIARDKTNFIAYFDYAYAISRESEDADGKIDHYPDEAAEKMRAALNKAIELEPKFAESFRLLAFLDFLNNVNLDEASQLLRRGLALHPSNPDFEILLAKVELARERYDDAKALAEKLSHTSTEPAIRADAEEILRTVSQYIKARLEVGQQSSVRLPWMSSLVFLKRSWLTDSDIAKIDRDREINNLNRALERPRQDEKQIVGTIKSVACSKDGINYQVTSEGKDLRFTSNGFQGLRMAVLLEGEHSFEIDCGVNFGKYLTVIAFRPIVDNRPNSIPQLTSITFVPDFFVLRTPAELASMRAVVVEEDNLRRGSKSGSLERIFADDPESRWTSISQQLRHPEKDETRELGTMKRIDCGSDALNITVSFQNDRRLELRSVSPKEVKVSWFGVESTQVPLACGSEPNVTNVIFTFVPEGPAKGTLKAIEFVPTGFRFPDTKVSELAPKT
jgi:tetratricopeptide (TPR) repeat protein